MILPQVAGELMPEMFLQAAEDHPGGKGVSADRTGADPRDLAGIKLAICKVGSRGRLHPAIQAFLAKTVATSEMDQGPFMLVANRAAGGFFLPVLLLPPPLIKKIQGNEGMATVLLCRPGGGGTWFCSRFPRRTEI